MVDRRPVELANQIPSKGFFPLVFVLPTELPHLSVSSIPKARVDGAIESSSSMRSVPFCKSH